MNGWRVKPRWLLKFSRRWYTFLYLFYHYMKKMQQLKYYMYKTTMTESWLVYKYDKCARSQTSLMPEIVLTIFLYTSEWRTRFQIITRDEHTRGNTHTGSEATCLRYISQLKICSRIAPSTTGLWTSKVSTTSFASRSTLICCKLMWNYISSSTRFSRFG